ncbi:hypothetical protein [Psychrobacter lutiphocae]|uniref:hypothetical protein n=1 Tax=Psychrobacter lutiphocae TaxID=540500 RepID=UPI00035D5615|nr:hypothetical protein [Psychrobacter lutiphocae]
MQSTQQPTTDTTSESYADFDDNLKFSVSDIWSYVTDKVKTVYNKATNSVDDEFSLPVSQQQVNDALEKFVTKNVKQIHELRVELHDDWFRLYCTVDVAGIYAEVASNFGLVHVQVDRDVQRFVFAQQTYTDVLKLHCESFLKRTGVKLAIWFYHSVLKKDPLGFILNKINIAKPKDNIIYLDINRWLKRNKKIISTLHKVQVNYGIVEEEQLVLKTKVNMRDLLTNNGTEDLITPKDEPELLKGPTHPISDAITPSEEG